MFRPPTGDFQPDAPYVVAVVELREGVRLISHIIECPPDRVSIEMPVEVSFERVSGARFPKFRPLPGHHPESSR